jgi:PAS domain S-box-containing protein
MKVASGPDSEKEWLWLQAAALEAAANGIIITDTKGIIQRANPAFTRLTGYSLEEAIGQSTRLLKSGKQDPSYYEDLWGTVTAGKVWHGELINRRKDGSHYIEEMTITPVCDVQGKVCHFISIKQDVTARRTAEEKLRKTLDQLEVQYLEAEQARGEARAILDATSEAMIFVSPDDAFLAVNRAFEQFFHLKAKKILGRRFAELMQHFERIFEDPAGMKARFEEASRNRHMHRETVAQCWPQKRELEVYSSPVQNARGGYLGRLFVFRDVTHERGVERLKSEFVSLVSHELRTPLTSIVGYVNLLLDGDAGELNEEQISFLETVRRNSDRLTLLVGDLLDVSRIEAGAIQLKSTEVDLFPLAQGVAECLRLQIESKKQILNIDMGRELPPVSGDTNRITQILTNLLSNAHKYTPPGGSIHITASLENEHVRISVKDTGIGLSKEEQDKLFTKFFRADNPATQKVGGTGLGLWITRSLVEMQGGEIRVMSAPGEGSTFSFTLPVSRSKR